MPARPVPKPGYNGGPHPVRRLLPWILAILALAFVIKQVPVRDRCWDPRTSSTKTAVSRTEAGCVLHLDSGDVAISRQQCEELKCEPGVLSTFRAAKVGVVGGLFLVYVLGTLAWAARWRALLGFAGVELSLMRVWRISVEAQAGGVLLPGGIGGDALRIASVVALPAEEGQARAPASIIVASVLLDRVIGLSLIAAVAAAFGFAWGGAKAGWLVVALTGIPVGCAAGVLVLMRAPLHRVRLLTEGRLGRVVNPILSYVRDPRAPRAIAIAVVLSLFVSLAQFIAIRGLVYALGSTPTQEKWVYVGAAMAFIVSALPTLPGGWGTADATYVLFFAQGGIPASTALGVCLLFRLFWYLVAMGGAVLFVARPRAAPVAEPAASAPKP
jgi:uncharacterized membrane protein YbhN (UPF0104 family)